MYFIAIKFNPREGLHICFIASLAGLAAQCLLSVLKTSNTNTALSKKPFPRAAKCQGSGELPGGRTTDGCPLLCVSAAKASREAAAGARTVPLCEYFQFCSPAVRKHRLQHRQPARGAGAWRCSPWGGEFEGLGFKYLRCGHCMLLFMVVFVIFPFPQVDKWKERQ